MPLLHHFGKHMNTTELVVDLGGVVIAQPNQAGEIMIELCTQGVCGYPCLAVAVDTGNFSECIKSWEVDVAGATTLMTHTLDSIYNTVEETVILFGDYTLTQDFGNNTFHLTIGAVEKFLHFEGQNGNVMYFGDRTSRHTAPLGAEVLHASLADCSDENLVVYTNDGTEHSLRNLTVDNFMFEDYENVDMTQANFLVDLGVANKSILFEKLVNNSWCKYTFTYTELVVQRLSNYSINGEEIVQEHINLTQVVATQLDIVHPLGYNYAKIVTVGKTNNSYDATIYAEMTRVGLVRWLDPQLHAEAADSKTTILTALETIQFRNDTVYDTLLPE